MSQIRINFLNYNPDLEDTENQGLSVAQNIIHEPEGYKEVHLATSTAFSTTGGLAASVYTVQSVVAKQVGAGDDLFCGWIANNTLYVGLNGVTAASNTTGYPATFSTAGASQEVTAFDVCEYAGKIFFVVEGKQTESTPATIGSVAYVGYMDY